MARAYRPLVYRAVHHLAFGELQDWRTVAARLLRLAKRLYDDAVVGALAEGVVDGRPVARPAIRRNLRTCSSLPRFDQDQATRQVINQPIRRLTVALAECERRNQLCPLVDAEEQVLIANGRVVARSSAVNIPCFLRTKVQISSHWICSKVRLRIRASSNRRQDVPVRSMSRAIVVRWMPVSRVMDRRDVPSTKWLRTSSWFQRSRTFATG